MKRKEFNLSDKVHRTAYEDNEDLDNLYDEQDVKEFIKRLKSDMCDFLVPSKLNNNDYESLMNMIDRLAGDKLK